jgi:TonB family protein
MMKAVEPWGRVGRTVVLCAIAFLEISCGAPSLPAGKQQITTTAGGGGHDHECEVVKGVVRPWLVASNLTDRIMIENRPREGVLLVQLKDCVLKVLYGCEVQGTYELQQVALKPQQWIKNEDELFAKLPLGASRLVKEYQDGDTWSLESVVTGMKQAQVGAVGRAGLVGKCAEATHYVSGIAFGAYRLASEAKRRAAIETDPSAAGTIRQAGDFDACRSGASTNEADCHAMVQLFLEPLGDGPTPPMTFDASIPPKTGILSKQVIRRVVHEHLDEVRLCYEQELASRPILAGWVDVSFVISESGAVQSAEVTESTFGEPNVEQCIAQAVRKWAFPATEGGGIVIVTYPFELSPGQE